MKKNSKIFTILFLTILCQLIALPVSAKCTCAGETKTYDKSTCSQRSLSENCSWTEDSTTSGSEALVGLTNPLQNAGVNNVPQLIGKIINALLGLVGSLALIMFIYGGFTWMLAAGNDANVKKGRDILTWATIGLVVIFASYSLVHFIIKSIAQ
ncbi:MAG: pilin [Patescibacteria group bacterium]|jgi:hypothetical protein